MAVQRHRRGGQLGRGADSKESFLLLRVEIPAEKLRERLYPNQEFLQFAFRFDFFNVTLDTRLPKEVFRLDGPPDGSSPKPATQFVDLKASKESAKQANKADEAVPGESRD